MTARIPVIFFTHHYPSLPGTPLAQLRATTTRRQKLSKTARKKAEALKQAREEASMLKHERERKRAEAQAKKLRRLTKWKKALQLARLPLTPLPSTLVSPPMHPLIPSPQHSPPTISLSSPSLASSPAETTSTPRPWDASSSPVLQPLPAYDPGLPWSEPQYFLLRSFRNSIQKTDYTMFSDDYLRPLVEELNEADPTAPKSIARVRGMIMYHKQKGTAP